MRKKHIKTKVCSGCKKEKDVSKFYKKIKSRDGFDWSCSECVKSENKKYSQRLKNRKDQEIIVPENKKCNKCGEIKARKYFSKCRSRKNGLVLYCKQCSKEQGAKYFQGLRKRKFSEIIIPSKKKCTKCGETKATNEFYKSIFSRDGLTGRCIKCRKKIKKESGQKLRNRKDKDIIYPSNKKCNKCGKTKKIFEFYKDRCSKDGLLSICKLCHKKCMKKYRNRINLYKCKYEKNKRKINPYYRLEYNLRSRFGQAFRSQRVKKSTHTVELIGCSWDYLIKYLESQFDDKMTWENYGRNGWNVDHIKPCVAFDLTKPEEQKACFHYTNLQSLWGLDNCKKNSFYNGKLIRKNT